MNTKDIIKIYVRYVLRIVLISVFVMIGGFVWKLQNETPGPRHYCTDNEIPDYCGEAYIEINGNVPDFKDSDFTKNVFEEYSELDELGRCGIAYANICEETMPTEERESIGAVKPSGWHTANYGSLVDGNYLYNRCHLIGFQLAGENANEKNLITGTRYFNTEGMLPFENLVADVVKHKDYHVLYRVTPIYEEDNLVASGVEMEAASVEDKGKTLSFHVYVYNVQPGVQIDYATGESELDKTGREFEEKQKEKMMSKVEMDSVKMTGSSTEQNYIINMHTKKFHRTTCENTNDILDKNKKKIKCVRDALIEDGYTPCKQCSP